MLDMLNNPMIVGTIALLIGLFLPQVRDFLGRFFSNVKPTNPQPAPVPNEPLPTNLAELGQWLLKRLTEYHAAQFAGLKEELRTMLPREATASSPVTVRTNEDGHTEVQHAGLQVTMPPMKS